MKKITNSILVLVMMLYLISPLCVYAVKDPTDPRKAISDEQYEKRDGERLVTYQSYVEGTGWQKEVSDGLTSGTEGESKRIEGIKIKLADVEYSGDVEYEVHIQDYGWLGSVKNGEVAGKIGEDKRVEAIRIKLTGAMANKYSVKYI